MRKPLELLTPRRLRRVHGISWSRLRSALRRGEVTPFATTGETNRRGCVILFHERQVPWLIANCKNVPRAK